MKSNKLVWAAQIVLGIAFLFFGGAKLLVDPVNTVQVFGSIGGTTAQYSTGVYQILAAILVVIPTTAFLGAILIMISMAVAILLHIFILGFAGPFLALTIVAVILLVVGYYVAKKRRKDFWK